MGYDKALTELLNVVYVAEGPLNFYELHKRSGLLRPCLTRKIEKGGRMGLLKTTRDEVTQEPSWEITHTGRRIYDLTRTD